jgi:hypothetical protein
VSRNLFEYHPVISYRFIPGLVARVRHEAGGYLVRCNQSGFRCDREVTKLKPANTFRIIVFGDSYTAGDGVSNVKRYSDLIESRLEQVEVLNFGLSGSGTDQQFLVFQEYASQIEYDLMVISPQVSNIDRITGGEQITMNTNNGQLVKRFKPYYQLQEGRLKLENQPVPRKVQQIDEVTANRIRQKDSSLIKQRVRKIYKQYPEFHGFLQKVRNIRSPIEYEDPNNQHWLLMKAILTDWIQQSKAPVILCPIPTFPHIYKYISPDGYLQRFQELSAETNIKIVNILPEFWKLSHKQRKSCRFEIDDHPTELGHEVIANALTPHIRKHYEFWRDNNA